MSNVRTLTAGSATADTEALHFIVAKTYGGRSIVVWQLEVHTSWDGACIGLAEAQGHADAEGTDPDAWAIYGLFPVASLDQATQPRTFEIL